MLEPANSAEESNCIPRKAYQMLYKHDPANELRDRILRPTRAHSTHRCRLSSRKVGRVVTEKVDVDT